MEIPSCLRKPCLGSFPSDLLQQHFLYTDSISGFRKPLIICCKGESLAREDFWVLAHCEWQGYKAHYCWCISHILENQLMMCINGLATFALLKVVHMFMNFYNSQPSNWAEKERRKWQGYSTRFYLGIVTVSKLSFLSSNEIWNTLSDWCESHS